MIVEERYSLAAAGRERKAGPIPLTPGTMTERLYYTDAYLRTFDAHVVERADEGRRVYLDRTAFYPTSGGQPFDTGSLGAARVLDVVDEEGRIAHLLDRPLAEGLVSGAVDWPRRFDHMQQHTGQHLLSAVIAELYGFATTSVHFGAAASTLDLEGPGLDPAQVTAIEERANAVATENRPVLVEFVEAGEAAGLRKASDREGRLRIVVIPDLDRSACGGTHVAATGEIGPILLRRLERVRKAVRVEFLCGLRAVRRARADFNLLARIAAPYSAAADELPELLQAQREELRQAVATGRELAAAVNARRARELYDAAPPDSAGIRRVLVRAEPGLTTERLRALAQAVTALPRALFAGATPEAAVLLACSDDTGLDAGRTLRPALERVGGRGGGNARLAQGTVPAESLDGVLRALLVPPS
ncbi:MAG TPA: DHHA1 domain-containing protein [Gemmatimonadales bacterium]|nr:DHHA1 domain-containing protein [Gemmatimonadales bacterium]